MNKRTAKAYRPVVALVALAALLLTVPTVVPAEEQRVTDGVSDDPLGAAHYVIKVTPALAYLDIGSPAGVAPGQTFVVLREEMGLYVPVAKVRVLRVFDGFSIAETYLVEPGEEVAVLQRAVATGTWEAAAPGLDARLLSQEVGEPPEMVDRSRSIMILGGLDGDKGVDLLYVNNRLTGADDVGGAALGLRLSKAFTRRLRLALTYRVSGEPLGGDADVTQLSVELDGQFLFRGVGRAGPYIGLGAGMHQLAWDSTANLDDTAYKMGFNAVGGLELPLAGGGWSLQLEGGVPAGAGMEWRDRRQQPAGRRRAGRQLLTSVI
ncbi:MAG: hypothetical protein QF689_06150 [Candidatus Latescibacteria bacterium]|nr:hypothetical protein [Candidatus Latescibacterota bacterium]